MFAASTRLSRPSITRQLRVAVRSRESRLHLGTFQAVDVVLYPEQPGGRQSTLACLRASGGNAYVDSAHYGSLRSFSDAVEYAVEYLSRPA